MLVLVRGNGFEFALTIIEKGLKLNQTIHDAADQLVSNLNQKAKDFRIEGSR